MYRKKFNLKITETHRKQKDCEDRKEWKRTKRRKCFIEKRWTHSSEMLLFPVDGKLFRNPWLDNVQRISHWMLDSKWLSSLHPLLHCSRFYSVEGKERFKSQRVEGGFKKTVFSRHNTVGAHMNSQGVTVHTIPVQSQDR